MVLQRVFIVVCVNVGVGVKNVNLLVVEIIFDLLFTLAELWYASAWYQFNLEIAILFSVEVTADLNVAVNKAF